MVLGAAIEVGLKALEVLVEALEVGDVVALEAAMEAGVAEEGWGEAGVEAAVKVGMEMSSSWGKLQLGPRITGGQVEAAQQHLRWPLLTIPKRKEILVSFT